jgi:hypothetical protein
MEQWGINRHDFEWERLSDSEGRVIWNGAPTDVDLQLYFRKDDFCYTRMDHIRATGTEQTIRMHRVFKWTAEVREAETGELLQEAKALPGYGTTSDWDRSGTRYLKNGTINVSFTEFKMPWFVRVEAEGYQPFWTNVVPSTGGVQIHMIRSGENSVAENSSAGNRE